MNDLACFTIALRIQSSCKKFMGHKITTVYVSSSTFMSDLTMALEDRIFFIYISPASMN